MKKLSVFIKITTLFLLLIITQTAKSYIIVTRNNGIFGYYNYITENRTWDPLVNQYRYTLLCADPGTYRCKFNTYAGEAALIKNNGQIVNGEQLDPYIGMADNEINNGVMSGTIVTADGIVVTWTAQSTTNSTIGLYTYAEAQTLGIIAGGL